MAGRHTSIRELNFLYGQMVALQPNALGDDDDRIADELVRRARRWQRQQVGAGTTTPCITLDPSAVAIAAMLPDDDAGDRLVAALFDIINKFDPTETPPILVPDDLTLALAALVSAEIPHLDVFAVSELEDSKLEVVATVTV